MEKVAIRGINILACKNECEFVEFLMSEHEIKTGKLIAINAEKIIVAEKQSEIKELLRQAEYNYADGMSIVFSIKKKYPQFAKIERIAGVDLWQALMKRSALLKVPVFLLGSSEDTLQNVKAQLIQWNVKIVGTQHGYFPETEEKAVIDKVKESGAKFITVEMGSPKQEKLMQKMQQQYPNALYMGVGGTYDVFTGKINRAPKNWQKLNLEWLYRLCCQPTRWRRQLNLLQYAYYYLMNKL